MPVFEEFPYTNFHELNLDWLIKEMKDLRSDFADFVGGHVITYADPIQWDITRTYPAYCIVLDSAGNAYMSVQEVPGGIALTDTNYWMQIGNFYAAVPQILEDEGIYSQVRAKNFFRYYIDGVNGSDDNDGLTSSTAFKTLNKFLSYAGSKYTEIRCYIITAGNYTVSSDNISCLNVHITANVADVHVTFESPDNLQEVAVYSSHWNLRGVNASTPLYIHTATGNPGGAQLYFDNSMVNLYCCNIDCYFSVHGSSLYIETCTLNRLRCTNSNIYVTGLNITNTNPAYSAISMDSCIASLIGTFTNSGLTANGTSNAFLDLWGSVVFFGSIILHDSTYKYFYGINNRYSIIMGTDARYTSIGDYSVHGNRISSGYRITPIDDNL